MVFQIEIKIGREGALVRSRLEDLHAHCGCNLYMTIHKLELRFEAILLVLLCTDAAIICVMMSLLYRGKGQ